MSDWNEEEYPEDEQPQRPRNTDSSVQAQYEDLQLPEREYQDS
jgi:hypothetical protein